MFLMSNNYSTSNTKRESTAKIFVAFELCNILSDVYTTSHDYVEAISYMRFVATVTTGRRRIFFC